MTIFNHFLIVDGRDPTDFWIFYTSAVEAAGVVFTVVVADGIAFTAGCASTLLNRELWNPVNYNLQPLQKQLCKKIRMRFY